jgi:hypothetical protein
MAKKKKPVILTDEGNGEAGVEFTDDTSLRRQREIIEDSIRKTERERPGSTDASVQAEIDHFRRQNKEMIAQEWFEETFGRN